MDDAIVQESLVTSAELVAVGVLIAGIIVARLASVGIGALLNTLDQRAATTATTEASILSPRLIRVVRSFVFWFIMILSIAIALRYLGVGGISSSLDAIIDFIPQALIGFLIIVAGHFLGLLVSNLLLQADEQMAIRPIVPRLVHGTIVAVAVVMGLQQIAVDISFVTRLVLLLIAIVGTGLVLAFALGARRHVANLMAHRESARLIIGERIRIDGLEGTVSEIHATGVDITTADGIATIPASRFAESIVVHVEAGDDDG